ncbi:hypothetical protein HYT57_02520 [Candidatus Woesearchaeota archaeon]|nr:hypothetical protein [Candidatus Woesearchaeota archaeon]
MKKLRIRKIDVLSTGKIVGIIYLIIGVFLGLIFSIIPTMGFGMMGSNYGSTFGSMMYGGAAIILFPILYGIMGFLAGLIGAFLYNLIAGWIGPIEIETD